MARLADILLFTILSVAFTLGSCKGDDPKKEPTGESFDKGAMLTDIAEEVILPSYADVQSAMVAFKESFQSFKSDPSQSNFELLRDRFNEVRLRWQYASPFEFGPAEDQGLRLGFNTFPSDTGQIEENIENGDHDFASAQSVDAKGLPAMEYLLFNFDNTALAEEGRLDYLDANIDYLTDLINEVTNAWEATYKDEFVSSLGTDVGSSTGQLVNQLNYDFELVKNAKVGIPFGKKSLGVAQPEQVEAFYSRDSKALVVASLEGLKNAFTGGQGIGLDDHLDALDAQYNGQYLSIAIISGFDDAIGKANAISGSLYESIDDHPDQVEALHTSLQNLVVLLKTDMPSQLGVQITYQDNDGD